MRENKDYRVSVGVIVVPTPSHICLRFVPPCQRDTLPIFSRGHTLPDLTEPIDVYTDWIDECEAVNAVEGVQEERRDDAEFIDNREIAEG